MRNTQQPFVKICCIASPAEAAMAISAGASALGLVSAMPSGPGVIDEESIAQIISTVPSSIETFLLTSRQDADSIVDQHRRCPSSTIQLVDHVTAPELKKLRSELPATRLVQVIHVTGTKSIEEAATVAPMVDAVLLDSGNQELAVKELGGTGRTHDWGLSRRIRDAVNIPLFLAGGLNADNIHEAMGSVQPFGLDLCSSVRTGAHLDKAKLEAFMNAVEQHAGHDVRGSW